MSKQFKWIILVNMFLGFLYVFSSYLFWVELNNWYDWNMQSTWTPFYVYPHRIPNMSTVEMPVFPLFNAPFIVFCGIIVTNAVMLAAYFYIIPRLQRWASKSV